MASEFAWRIAEQSLNGSGLRPEHIKVLKKGAMHIADAELQEVRFVLLGLQTSVIDLGDHIENHWCNPDGDNCNNICERARALLERLRVKEQNHEIQQT